MIHIAGTLVLGEDITLMHHRFYGLFALLLVCSPVISRADELTVKGRAILEKNQDSVVTVQVVLKTSSAGARTSENKQDITGTVVDPSGLTVLALSACDPYEMFQRMMADEFSRANVQSEVTDLRILLDEGDPSKVDALERAFLANQVTAEVLFATGTGVAPWMASVTFGGPDLRTVYIGSLRGNRIPYFRAPVPGLPMIHWHDRS